MQDRQALETEIVRILGRTDLTADLPAIVRRGEQRIWRDTRVAPIEHEREASITATSNVVDVPDDFSQAIYIIFNESEMPLQRVTPEQLIAAIQRQTSLISTHPRQWLYTLIARDDNGTAKRAIKLGPWDISEDTPGEVYYTAYQSQLTAANSTNFLLQEHESLYLYSCLIEAAPLIGNDARMATWSALYDDAATTLQMETRASRQTRSGLAARSEVRAI